MKLQGRADVVLRVCADVQEQSLELQDPEGRPLSCLRFGSLYFGTAAVERLVVRNSGPQACHWVVVLLEDAPGTELVNTPVDHAKQVHDIPTPKASSK